MKRNLVWALAAALFTGGLFASCSDDDNNDDQGDGAETSYVIAVTVDNSSTLLTASSLDEGTVGVGNGLVSTNGTYWVYYKDQYLYRLNYNQGSAGVSESYVLDANGSVAKRDYQYSIKRFTTYGIYGNEIITVSAGNRTTGANADGDLPRGLQFSYLDTDKEIYTSAEINAEDYLGNGEYVSFAGVLEANDKIYTAVIPMGMSVYGVKQYPEDVVYQNLIKTEDGGSNSSAYKKGELQWTQHPNEANVAIFNNRNFDNPLLLKTTKISYACGRSASQYYQTTWAADNGDIYVFSPSYSKMMEAEVQRTILPAGVARIKAGETKFDDDYYFNIEEATGGKSFLRCWHLQGDYFLLRMYDQPLAYGTTLTASTLAIYKAGDKKLITVTGLPSADVFSSYSDGPFSENGKAYIGVTTTTGDDPAIYKIDMATAVATKGVTLTKAASIKSIGKLSYKQ